MTHSIFDRSISRFLLPTLVCLSTVVIAWWLYRQTPGIGSALGVAEAREYTISALEAGRLASVQVTPGERVTRGQLLATLDTELIEQQTKVAKAELLEIEAQVRAEGKSLDLSGLRADRTFQADLEEAEIEFQEATAAYTRDTAELDEIRKELNRQRELVERRLVSADRLKELQIRAATLEEAVRSYNSRLEMLAERKKASALRRDDWISNVEL